MKNQIRRSLHVLGLLVILLASNTLWANSFPSPTNVRIDGNQLRWDAVSGAGGYNIYWNRGYLTTVKNGTNYTMQIDGLYQVVAFDQSATQFSSQFADGVGVDYEVGADPSVTDSLGDEAIKVVGVTCQNVGPGESCTASCLVPNNFRIATGGACSTSDIIEADASASAFAYTCTVPTFSGEVTAQVYCLNRRLLGR